MSVQKIDNSRLEIYKMVIVLFEINDKDKKTRFFEKTFLLADISIDVAFKVLFLSLTNVEVNFNNRQLR